MHINFDNTYVKLPENFYTKIRPVPVTHPELSFFNWSLANELGLTVVKEETQEIAEVFSGNSVLEGSEPISLVYAGHQFGYFVPQLGDGRTVMLGEAVDKKGDRYDIQLKGSGKTPYSRGNDGRAALGPMLREYIVSEAMHGLRIKTTRSLALVTTGEPVFRDTILPGAIITRVASSHIRVGTFEYFAAKRDVNSLKLLADYAINRHAPQAKDAENPYLSFLETVLDTQTSLVVDWLRVGFIHGVMNTDNTSISGETIDYGPCAFLDTYVPNKVFSSIDRNGRYAFNQQFNICLWNFTRLAETLGFLLHPEPESIQAIIKNLKQLFTQKFHEKYVKMMANKIGIFVPCEEDKQLIQNLFNIMEENHFDYTLTFRYLIHFIQQKPWVSLTDFTASSGFQKWIETWKVRLETQSSTPEEIAALMSHQNPVLIPRNHRIEEAITYALEHNDFSKAERLIQALSNPYENDESFIDLTEPPTPQQCVYQTFCGT
ncbi:MAG: YdiU family protein [Alphaproteobacteria bacterium]|nr:YdiU family protein [Alphaproteobacteria bacterium]